MQLPPPKHARRRWGPWLALLGGLACQTPDVTDVPPNLTGGTRAMPGGVAALGGNGPATGALGGAGVDPDPPAPGGAGGAGGAGGSGGVPGEIDAATADAAPAAAETAEVAPAESCRCTPSQICVAGQCKDRGEVVPPGFDTCANPPCINVLNNCAVPLWTHAVATAPIDDGNVRRLNPGDSFRYTALPAFGGGRLYAYYKEPEIKQDRWRLVSDFNQFVEMTLDRDEHGRWAQNYNISYVDYASLPVLMKGAGATCEVTQCGFRYADWTAKLKECPTDLRNQHGDLATCTASYNYCITPAITPAGPASYDVTKPYCQKMQTAHGFSGSAVYGGVFPQHPATDLAFWDQVAAWNRGTFAGDGDDSHYYSKEPFNHYAGWIHKDLGCPRVYAFSTDDHQDKAGFVRCTADELSVVWCPNR